MFLNSSNCIVFAAFFLKNSKLDTQDPELISETESQHQRFLKNLINNMKFQDEVVEPAITPPPAPPPF